uniref:Succinate dehydrogenase n=1 Tax=Geoglobus ahangari TaxID=113653 RepID=A0A7C4S5L1_9EURY
MDLNVVRSWFGVRGKEIRAGILFTIHRLTGILMVVLLLVHLYAFNLSTFIGYNYYKILFSLALFHGLNGVRVSVQELGYLYRARKVISSLTICFWLIGTLLIFMLL